MPNITRASLQPTIVGGYQLSASLLPFLVNILTDDGFVCSGTLIAPTWVVTASHCNVQTTTTVRVNSRQVANDGTIVPVKRVIFEPRGGPDAEVGDFFDIMLVELDMDVRDLGLNSFMRVNLNRKFPRANSFVRAIGYGAISDDEIIPDPARFSVRQNDLPVTPFKQCERKYVAGTSNTDSLSNKFQFCAGYINEAGCGTW